MITGKEELERWLDKHSRLFEDAVKRMAWARFQGTWKDRMRERKNMATLIQHTMILADMRGRKRVLMEVNALDRSAKFAAKTPPLQPTGDKTPLSSLSFREAIDDILSRDPKLAEGYREVTRLYNEGHVFALARAAEGNVDDRLAMWRTKEVQKALVEVERAGKGIDEFGEMMQEIGPWSKWYADVLYRTNISNAVSNGRFAQALDEDVQEVAPALELVGVSDDRERPNHAAAMGFTATAKDPRWSIIRPPLGYNCRHGVNLISKGDLERRGLFKNGEVIPYIPPNFHEAHPDPGFKAGAL